MTQQTHQQRIAFVSASACFVLAAGGTHADVLAEYRFDADSPASTDTNAYTTASDLIIADWIEPINQYDTNDPTITSNWLVARAEDTNPAAQVGYSQLSDAIPAQNYVAFILDGTGYSIDQVSFDYSTQANSPFLFSTHLLSDQTGLTDADSLVTTTLTGTDATSVSVSLSGYSAMQNVNGPIEFRLYFSDSTWVPGNTHRIDNIVVEGSASGETIDPLADDVYMLGNDLYVGDTADGAWTLHSGPKVTTNGYIAVGAGVNGTATVDGATAVWENSGNLTVGVNGNASLVVKNGGTVQAANFYLNDDVDWQDGSLIVDGGSISGAGKLNGYTPDYALIVGDSTAQTLVFQSGATHAVSGSVTVGRQTAGDGTLTIQGAGSSVNAASGSAFVGERGAGQLNVTDGGTFTSALGYVGSRYASGAGTVVVDGAGSSWAIANRLWVGDDGVGEVTVRNGGTLSTDYGYVGGYGGDTGTGTVTVDGAGSTFSVKRLILAHTGDSTVNVTNGGTLDTLGTSHTVVGGGYSGSALVRVVGTGSTWDHAAASSASTLINQAAVTGNAGRGALVQILDGGVFNSGGVTVGNTAGQRGTVEVTGAGSAWNSSKTVTIGKYGEGYLTIGAGATTSLSTVHIGNQSAGYGSVTVDGAGSQLNATNLYAGKYGTASLSVTNGASIHATGNMIMGHWSSGTASLDLTGSGSTLTVDGSLDVGYHGTGQLRIADGATAKVRSELMVGTAGTVYADGTITDTGVTTLTVVNKGLLSAGDDASNTGLLTIEGKLNLTSAGDLVVDIGGTNPGTTYDQLIVTDVLGLNGGLSLQFVDGYLLTAGDSFKIIDADSSAIGTFAGLSEGALVGTYNSNDLYITYVGGLDGKDVMLYTPTGSVAVPEPTSLALLSLGGLGLLRRRRSA
jgi:T5SS/PEP-CTERM-associated repeat protein